MRIWPTDPVLVHLHGRRQGRVFLRVESAIPDVTLFTFVKHIVPRTKEIPLERLVSESNRVPQKIVLKDHHTADRNDYESDNDPYCVLGTFHRFTYTIRRPEVLRHLHLLTLGNSN
jgi:hypothetical protein